MTLVVAQLKDESLGVFRGLFETSPRLATGLNRAEPGGRGGLIFSVLCVQDVYSWRQGALLV